MFETNQEVAAIKPGLPVKGFSATLLCYPLFFSRTPLYSHLQHIKDWVRKWSDLWSRMKRSLLVYMFANLWGKCINYLMKPVHINKKLKKIPALYHCSFCNTLCSLSYWLTYFKMTNFNSIWRLSGSVNAYACPLYMNSLFSNTDFYRTWQLLCK